MSSGQGVVFPTSPDGRVSTMATNQAVFAAAARPVDPEVARRIEAEPDWRTGYVDRIVELVHLGLRSPEDAMTISAAGLDELRNQMRFDTGNGTTDVDAAMQTDAETIAGVEVQGTASGAIGELKIPYQGDVLVGSALRRQLDDWMSRGIVEPSFVEAISSIIDNPDWLDLQDESIVVMGAGSEMGPFGQLCEWGARIMAVDLPRPAIWSRLIETARSGRGTLVVPVPTSDPVASSGGVDAVDPRLAEVAGVDLLTQAPDIAGYLRREGRPLTIGNYTYANGGVHVRLSVAIDAIMTSLPPESVRALAFLATPTDVFSVSQEVRMDAQRRFAKRRVPLELDRPVAFVSRGAVLAEHYRDADPHTARVVSNNLVARQGPNYALAKRMQRWRASVARGAGTRVSLNIAPPTRTKSVLQNRAFSLAYNGMSRFGIEVFDPDTSNALGAAMLVHDLRNPNSTANSDVPLDHPLDLFNSGANPGGMWRCPYEPNSIMAAATIAGLFEGRA
jgi:hypothetical protein